MQLSERFQTGAVGFLRWSEKYTKTDMVYLAQVAWWNNLNFIIVSILALGLSIAFANLLPREEYGLYQYLLSLSSLLAAFTLGGMNSAVTQSVARGYEGDLRAAVRVQLLWGVIPAAIGLMGGLYYLAQGNYILGSGLVIIALLTPATNAFNIYGAFLTGKREFKRIFLYGSISNTAYYSTIFITVFFFRNALALVFVNLAANAASTTFLYFRTLRAYKPNEQTDARTIPYGMHLSVMSGFGTIITQLDSILVFHFLGAVELAVYSFATLLPERVASLFKFVSNAALPKFANQTLEEIRRTIVSKTLRTAFAGAIVTIAYIIVAPIFFHLLFPKYLDALPYTILYSFVIITVAGSGVGQAALVSQRLHRELYVFNIGTPLILLVLQVPLLLLYGITGILMARIISNTINILMALLLLFYPFQNEKSD